MQWSSIRICLEKKLGTIGDDLWERDEKISEEENQMVESEFTEEEILQAIRGSYSEGAQD
jgi:hypothetical protein